MHKFNFAHFDSKNTFVIIHICYLYTYKNYKYFFWNHENTAALSNLDQYSSHSPRLYMSVGYIDFWSCILQFQVLQRLITASTQPHAADVAVYTTSFKR